MSVKQIKFLVPVAFSPQSDIIIEQASNLAKYYQAQITLMCVIDTSRTKGFFSNPQDEKKMLENAKNRYEELVMKVNAKYNIGANSIVIEGRTYESIVSVAKSIEADFIIMGAAGATGFKSHFIGSNAMRTIKRSHCPVITIRGRQHRSG